MTKYLVNRSAGYPIIEGVDANVAVANGEIKFYPFGAELESNDPACEKAVEQSYLLRVIEAAPLGAATIFALPADSKILESITKEDKSTLTK